MRANLARTIAGSCAVALLGLSGCSDPDRSTERFCGELATALPTLTGTVSTQADIDRLLATYDRLDEISPLSVERDWSALTDLVRTAATVAPDDPASVQAVADAAYSTERSARAVAQWVETTCGLAMPDVIGIEGGAPPSSAP